MDIEEIRDKYTSALVFLKDNEKEIEIRQLLVDLMDVCEQSELGDRINKLYNDFIG